MRILLRNLYHEYTQLNVVKKSMIWFMLCSFIQKCISVISTPIFTRLLTETEFGQYSLYMSWYQIISIFAVLKLDCGVFNKGMSRYSDKDDFTATIQTLVTCTTTITLIIYLIFRKYINAFTELSTLVTVGIFIQIYFQAAMSFWIIRERYDYKYKTVVKSTIVLALLNLFLGVIFVLLARDKGTARIVSCILAYVIVGCFMYILNYTRANKKYDSEKAGFALKFNLPLIPHYLSTYILEQSDRIMIQKIIGTAAVGLYNVAYNAGMVMKLISESINSALIPWQYRKLESRDYNEIDNVLSQMMYIITACLVLFMFLAPECMSLLASRNYYEAVYVIPPVSASILFLFVYGMYGNAEFFFDKNKFVMIISATGAILNITLNYVFIKKNGYIAAGYTTFVCYMLFAYGHLVFINKVSMKKTEYRIFSFKPLFICSLILTVSCILLSILYAHIIIRYLIFSVLLIMSIEKKDTVIKIIKKIKKI